MVKWQFIENEILAKLSTLTETKCVLGALGFFGGRVVCVCVQMFICDFKIYTEYFGSSWSDQNLFFSFYFSLCMSLIFY